MADIFNFLKSQTVEQVMLPASEVSSVKSTDLTFDAYRILVEKNVLSVPVFEDGKIVSFLDQIDILYYAFEV
jgi:signal-transduction protein with cAMP-binding, CBS, and nucleotidyltransferase domain